LAFIRVASDGSATFNLGTSSTAIATVTVDTWYRILVSHVTNAGGTYFKAKVWVVSSTEPDWLLTESLDSVWLVENFSPRVVFINNSTTSRAALYDNFGYTTGVQSPAQAQALIKTTVTTFAQAQAYIKITANGLGQAQASIKQVYFGLGQSEAKIAAVGAVETYSHSQAQALIYIPQHLPPISDRSNSGWLGTVI
jgi:hypothetical protein